MPEFILNKPAKKHPFYGLDEFSQGYIEALFFTNGDTCDEDDYRLNNIGVGRLTRAAIDAIGKDCAAFQEAAADILDEVTAGASPYDMRRAGNDFWFTRQGHGVGFWSRDELRFDDIDFGEKLSAIAKKFGEAYPEIYRGWIHYR